MENNRRSFFRTLFAPLVTLVLPKPTLSGAIKDGINPVWNGDLDQINAITLLHCHSEAHLLEFLDVGFKVKAKVDTGKFVASYGAGA